MNVKWLLVLTIPVVAISAAVFFYLDHINKADIHVNWNNNNAGARKTTSYVQIPEGGYNDVFSEMLGEKNWETARDLYKNDAGISKFLPGDIFSVTTSGDRIVSYGLHNYRNRTSGEKISFTKKGRKFVQSRDKISLEVKTVVKYMQIEKTLAEDNPVIYQLAKERLSWDWGILDKLLPGDSIAFMIKGIFDKDILVYTFGILGVSVKSTRMGDFTLTAFRDSYYGDYFVTGSRMMLSPQEQFRVPIDCGKITSSFGFRKDPFTRSKKFHHGIDIIARTDTPVRSAATGTVHYLGYKKGLGNTIIVDHGNGIRTLYGHLNRFLVSSGQTVAKGEVIAGAGSTGRSTSTHLHFSVLIDGKSVDPLQFTYERIWFAPFDISGDFRTVSVSRAIHLEEAMDKRKTLTVNEKFAELTPFN